MSCVVGVISDGKVFLGADGIGITDEGECRPIVAKKIIRNKNYIIGYTGSVRAGQLLHPHFFEPPDNIKDFGDAAREHLYAKGAVATGDHNVQMMTCNLLIGHQKKLYEVLMDFQVNETLGSFSAIGSGASYAMGAMYVLDEMNMGPVQKLEYALEAACKFHMSCSTPFDFEYI